MAQCQEPRAQMIFFGLHLYLAEKYCENLKVSDAQLNINPARAFRAITWFVGVTIYCTFFNNNFHLHLARFYATKYF